MAKSASDLLRPWWAKVTHGLIAISVIHQLAVAEWMSPPWEAKEATAQALLLFEFHETVGLVTLILLALMLIGLWRRQKERLAQPIYPWFNADARQKLFKEAQCAAKGLRSCHLPNSVEVPRLARAVQGLGILAVLFMACSGTVIWLLSESSPWLPDVVEVHEFGSSLVWAYLFGHAGMALWHEFKGERLIRTIFGK